MKEILDFHQKMLGDILPDSDLYEIKELMFELEIESIFDYEEKLEKENEFKKHFATDVLDLSKTQVKTEVLNEVLEDYQVRFLSGGESDTSDGAGTNDMLVEKEVLTKMIIEEAEDNLVAKAEEEAKATLTEKEVEELDAVQGLLAIKEKVTLEKESAEEEAEKKRLEAEELELQQQEAEEERKKLEAEQERLEKARQEAEAEQREEDALLLAQEEQERLAELQKLNEEIEETEEKIEEVVEEAKVIEGEVEEMENEIEDVAEEAEETAEEVNRIVEESRPCTNSSTDWRTGDWGTCDVGTKLKTRNIVRQSDCDQNADGAYTPDTEMYCDPCDDITVEPYICEGTTRKYDGSCSSTTGYVTYRKEEKDSEKCGGCTKNDWEVIDWSDCKENLETGQFVSENVVAKKEEADCGGEGAKEELEETVICSSAGYLSGSHSCMSDQGMCYENPNGEEVCYGGIVKTAAACTTADGKDGTAACSRDEKMVTIGNCVLNEAGCIVDWKVWYQNQCQEKTQEKRCEGKVDNAIWDDMDSVQVDSDDGDYTATWDSVQNQYLPEESECQWKCNSSYHEDGGVCVLNTNEEGCAGDLDSNTAIANEGDTFLQTWDDLSRSWDIASLSWSYNPDSGKCTFSCQDDAYYDADAWVCKMITYKWDDGDWGSCGSYSDCSFGTQEGVKTRDVDCVQEHDGIVVSDSKCSGTTMSVVMEACSASCYWVDGDNTVDGSSVCKYGSTSKKEAGVCQTIDKDECEGGNWSGSLLEAEEGTSCDGGTCQGGECKADECKDGYVLNGSECAFVMLEQEAACDVLPENAEWNYTNLATSRGMFTQSKTSEDGGWSPSGKDNIHSESAGECHFVCVAEYEWDGQMCVLKSRIEDYQAVLEGVEWYGSMLKLTLAVPDAEVGYYQLCGAGDERTGEVAVLSGTDNLGQLDLNHHLKIKPPESGLYGVAGCDASGVCGICSGELFAVVNEGSAYEIQTMAEYVSGYGDAVWENKVFIAAGTYESYSVTPNGWGNATPAYLSLPSNVHLYGNPSSKPVIETGILIDGTDGTKSNITIENLTVENTSSSIKLSLIPVSMISAVINHNNALWDNINLLNSDLESSNNAVVSWTASYRELWHLNLTVLNDYEKWLYNHSDSEIESMHDVVINYTYYWTYRCFQKGTINGVEYLPSTLGWSHEDWLKTVSDGNNIVCNWPYD